MQTSDSLERLIQEVLAELGSDANPGSIAERVRRLDMGLPAEDEFTAVCSWLGRTRLIHKLDQHQVPVRSREIYQIPDLLAQFENTGPLLVEVKSKAKATLSFRPDYLDRLNAYAALVDMPLLIAWKHYGLWTLFEARQLTKAVKNFNIGLGEALKENLLGVLAGDVAYKIAPGAGVRFRCRKEELLAMQMSGNTVTEQWQMRIDEVGFTIGGGVPVDDLDPDVTTLFTTWDLAQRQTHDDTHIDLHFVAGEDDGIMFGHMALTRLLTWAKPDNSPINWRHAIRRDAVVSNMTNFRQALNRALGQKVVHVILDQQPQSWPDFLPRKAHA